MRNKLNKPKLGNFVFIVIIFLLTIQLTSIRSQGNETLSDYDLALEVINQSRIDMQEMMDSDFGVLRVNDTLNQIEQLFEAQFALQEKGSSPDYSLVIEGAKEITAIKKKAEETSDELNALESRLKDVSKESEAYSLFNEAKTEFKDERYEKITELVEEAYVILSEEQSIQTRVGVVYTASTKTILGFLKRNLKMLTITIIFITMFYLIFRKKIAIFLIDRKIKELNFERGVLGNLVEKAQYEYFHLFKIPEELYQIRIEKFGELIRDIDRQIPLLLERKEKIKKSGEQFANEEERKAHKRFTIFSIFLIILILITVFPIALAIYLKTISYDELLRYIQSPWSIPILIILIMLILITILVLLYLNRKKQKSELSKFELEKRPRFIQFILNKSNSINLYIEQLTQKIRDWREYRRLLKQKREEETRGEKYLKKQRFESFINNIKGLFSTPILSIKNIFSNWKEPHRQMQIKNEERMIFAELQKRNKKTVIPKTPEKIVMKKEEVLKNLKKQADRMFPSQMNKKSTEFKETPTKQPFKTKEVDKKVQGLLKGVKETLEKIEKPETEMKTEIKTSEEPKAEKTEQEAKKSEIKPEEIEKKSEKIKDEKPEEKKEEKIGTTEKSKEIVEPKLEETKETEKKEKVFPIESAKETIEEKKLEEAKGEEQRKQETEKKVEEKPVETNSSKPSETPSPEENKPEGNQKTIEKNKKELTI